jgi:endoglycosylceramidase
MGSLRLAAATALAALLLALPGCDSRTSYPRFITDAQGRALILHGANVSGSAKNDPDRLPWVGPDDVQRLARDWGFDFARYLIFWDAVEPEPGVYDEAYLDAVGQRLDWFAAAGIQVVLDMHQDVYSSVFCCDGAPTWAIDDDGLPFEQTVPWWANYLEPAVLAAFDHFWDITRDHPGLEGHLQDYYAAAWRRVAERFADHPAVLGYDIMNEPSASSQTSLVELIGQREDPGGPSPAFDAQTLQPFYQRVITAIREVDPDGWIFYEPRYGAPATGLASYLGRLEDPREGEDHLAFFPHFYSIPVEISGVYDAEHDFSIGAWLRNRKREMDLQQAPLLIGEWGTVDSTANKIELLNDVMRMADRATSGWAYWEYNDDGFGFLQSKGGPEKDKGDALARTYPQRVAGRPTFLDYDPHTRWFLLTFVDAEGVTGPTEIYIPAARHYPDGWEIRVSDPDGTWSTTWDADREVLSLWTDPASSDHWVAIRPTGDFGSL